MKRIRFTLGAAVSLLCFLCASAAQAQSWRTWVSGTGDDANTCSRTAPCETFSGAQSKTHEGGEISVLDSGNYNLSTITITKSITINGEGAQAGIIAPYTHGLIVNVSTNPSTATVILRNLHINGMKLGLNGLLSGIRFLAGNSLVVDNCRIYGFDHGINVDLQGNGNLKVIDTVIKDVAHDGIHLTTTAGQVLATIERTHIMSCGNKGIHAHDHVRAQIRNCVFTHNLYGIVTDDDDSQLNVDNVYIANCYYGLRDEGLNSEIRISDSVITNNHEGVSGNVHSFQGNSLVGNVTNGSFVTTTLKQ
jgi:hypothetical protein